MPEATREKKKLYGDGFELLTSDIPDTEWRIKNVITTDENAVIIGANQSGKTTFSLYLSICIATGKDTPFGKTKPCKVLYIDEEMGKKGIKKKVKQICDKLGIKPEDLEGKWFYRTNMDFKFTDPKSVHDLYLLYEAKDVELIFIDSLIATSSGELIGLEDLQHLRNMLKKGKINDINVIFLHHFNRQNKEYGSVDIKNAFDNAFEITKMVKEKVIRLEQTKARYLDPSEHIDINIPFDKMSFGKPYGTSGYSYKRVILDVFKKIGKNRLSYSEIETEVVEPNPDIKKGKMSVTTMIKYLEQMCEEGTLIYSKGDRKYELN